MTTLRQAAQAVIERWDAPLWKDEPATAVYIAELRKALEAPEQEPFGYVFEYRDIIGSVIGAKGEWAPHEIPLYAAPVETPDIKALTKERDALMAAAKLALDLCVEFSRAPMTQVEYLNLLRTIGALKQAGVTA